MDYIVLDLEWNQPISYNSSAYRAVGERLLFEMIQIGAIRLNERLEMVDQFTQFIQPAQYVKLHPRIRRITGITQEMLCGAPSFQEAAASFLAWCGEDCALLTWGCDDISVFHQNWEFFGCEAQLPPMYDMQRLYGELIADTRNRAGLKAAMEHFAIEPDESHPFHNALNDAYYTALVFQRFPQPRDVLRFAQTPRRLVHSERARRHEKSDLLRVGRIGDAMNGKHAQTPPCPVCGCRCALSAGYVALPDGQRQALCVCEKHGLFFVRIHFEKGEKGRRMMARDCVLSEEQNPAYISTKILQWQNKRAAQEVNAL